MTEAMEELMRVVGGLEQHQADLGRSAANMLGREGDNTLALARLDAAMALSRSISASIRERIKALDTPPQEL